MSKGSAKNNEPKFNADVIGLVKNIEQQKELLEEIFELIVSLQDLSEGLENLLNNADVDHPLINSTFDLLDSLGEEQIKFSSEKIEFRLDNLELKIRDEISYFLDLVNPSRATMSPRQDAECLEDTANVIRVCEFKRKIKLSFAYRVLLCERGVVLEPIDLDVAPELVFQSISLLKDKENLYKDELLSQFKNFHASINKLSESSFMTEYLLGELSSIKMQVIENIKHLDAGQPVADIPIGLDKINFDVRALVMVKAKTSNEYLKEQASLASSEKIKDKKEVESFVGRVHLWLDSPMSTSWKDTKK